MMMETVRVLVVEDSLTIRRHIAELVGSADGFEVVGEAGDGKAAIELCRRLRPDVITMDMMLPVMTGLAATEYIMAYFPTPILIVSASTNRGELFKTYDALAAGAVDVLEKPAGTEPDGAWGRQLLRTLRIVARVRVVTRPGGKLRAPRGRPLGVGFDRPHRRPDADYRVVAIGASTGGPGAVAAVLRSLPVDYPLPVLVVIHISEPFGTAMAEWLDAQVKLPVRYARDGERLAERGCGCVLIGPPGKHVELIGSRLRLTGGPERHSCRPSVDVLFESLARQLGGAVMACLLTGMGKDGAKGLAAVRAAGGLTVAQDEETSVVFGMPKEAIKLGAACCVLPLEAIAPLLCELSATRSKTALGGRP